MFFKVVQNYYISIQIALKCLAGDSDWHFRNSFEARLSLLLEVYYV